jgi:uncharacterized membrane protein YoaK (UPF0700 family)
MNKYNVFELFFSIGIGFILGAMVGNLVLIGDITGAFMMFCLAVALISAIYQAEDYRKRMTGE